MYARSVCSPNFRHQPSSTSQVPALRTFCSKLSPPSKHSNEVTKNSIIRSGHGCRAHQNIPRRKFSYIDFSSTIWSGHFRSWGNENGYSIWGTLLYRFWLKTAFYRVHFTQNIRHRYVIRCKKFKWRFFAELTDFQETATKDHNDFYLMQPVWLFIHILLQDSRYFMISKSRKYWNIFLISGFERISDSSRVPWDSFENSRIPVRVIKFEHFRSQND